MEESLSQCFVALKFQLWRKKAKERGKVYVEPFVYLFSDGHGIVRDEMKEIFRDENGRFQGWKGWKI